MITITIQAESAEDVLREILALAQAGDDKAWAKSVEKMEAFKKSLGAKKDTHGDDKIAHAVEVENNKPKAEEPKPEHMNAIIQLVVAHQPKHGAQIKEWLGDTGASRISEIPEELQEEFLGKLEALK